MFDFNECDSIIFRSSDFELHYYYKNGTGLASSMFVVHKHDLSNISGNCVYKSLDSIKNLRFMSNHNINNLSIEVKWLDNRGVMRDFNFDHGDIKIIMNFIIHN